MPAVPMNKMQSRIARQENINKRPSSISKSSITVTIIEAWDSDRMAMEGIPREIAHLVSVAPGRMYARVKTASGKEYWLPFEAAESEIIFNHGNAVLLEGKRGTIVFNGVRPETGKLVLLGDPNSVMKSLSAGTFCADVVSFL
jgi:hypothetical protein